MAELAPFMEARLLKCAEFVEGFEEEIFTVSGRKVDRVELVVGLAMGRIEAQTWGGIVYRFTE